MPTATLRRTALLLLALLVSPVVLAQSIGDEFILFVDGTNVMVPSFDGGQVVNDPLDPTSGNKVARFNSGSWTHSGFAWDRLEGVDATAAVSETYGEGSTLYLRMLSDPANTDVPGISIMLSDATDDSGANDGTADPEFRLLWQIPNELHDGQWHDLAIPLPPTTYAALEEARANGELEDGAENWTYPGAWSTGGFGIGPGFGTDTEDPLWEEFGWDHLYRIGPFWDNNQASGPIYLDDVYIGGPNTDTSQASEPPAAMSNVSFTTDGAVNVVDWPDSEEFGGYNVYASPSPITDVGAEGVVLLKSVGFGEETELRHRYEVPHPSMGAEPLYYAVTSRSAFGVENPDVATSSGEIVNPDLPQKAYILELTGDQADALFDAVASGVPSDEAFGDSHPVFYLDSSHRSPGDGSSAATLPDDSDSSGEFKIGYSSLNEMFIYGEITDDQVTWAPQAETGANTWNYDSAEIVFGHYDVRNTVGGGIFEGSPHQDMMRGDEPDYGMRLTAFGDGAGGIDRTSTWVGWSIDFDIPGSTAVEETDTGWRFLTLLPLDQIQNTDEGDVFLPVPATDEIQYLPFIISINDADGGTRESQIVWSIKPNVTGQWWNTPAMWETVAMAGLDASSVAVEDPAGRDGFSLAQSVPNPTAGTADIAFTLGAATSVRLEVFNTLGQRVATLADGPVAAGPQSLTFDTSGLAAGVYVYRLSAGDYVTTRRMTVVR
ncbi:T9SS type A sorting domain-containing protein [Rubrivirga marina]|uniref:T9SS type A sorting domain-containing protein n=1 Tax=Rubrivirga marina TaxID=1196024 RepID=UPI000BA985F3|nr:T9SS type A sorting domain-containing protein [Rubrivirga marina]